MKTIVLTSIIFLFAIAIFSCSKRKTSATNNIPPTDTTSHHTDTVASIIGRWEADSIKISATISGYPVGEEDSNFVPGHSIIEIFNADSTVVIIDNTGSPADTTNAKYYVANGILYGCDSGQTNYAAEGNYSISNNQLVIQQTTDSLGAVIVEKLYSTRQ